ncbi:MAG: hypothetical protein E7472_04245 [Ruminococcaceae bacterium]|nr:hypothetical protein [Oscillospiraceae bacterium]
MLKRICSLILILCLLLATGASASAASGTEEVTVRYRGIRIEVDGETLNPCDANGNSTEPFIYNGSTYLPVRAVASALGLNVAWDEATSTVTLTSGGTVNLGSGEPASSSNSAAAQITYRNIRIVIDGKVITPCDVTGKPTEPFIYNGSTYLPVRAVASALGLDVAWDEATSTVSLFHGIYLPVRSYSCEQGWKGGVWERSVLISYNDNGAPTRIENTDDGVLWLTELSYDAAGNLLKSVETGGGMTYSYECIYDKDGRPLREYGGGTGYSWSAEYTHDAAGNLTREIYENSNPLVGTSEYTYRYDDAGNLTHSFCKYENSLRSGTDEYNYRYDAAGNCVFSEYIMNGAKDHSFTYEFDAANNLLSKKQDTASGTDYNWAYSYDAQGRILSEEHTSSDGYKETTRYTYDALGNVLREENESNGSDGYSDGYTYTYSYDEKGNELYQEGKFTNGNYFRYNRTFDERGNVLTVDFYNPAAGGWFATYTYDSQNRVTRMLKEGASRWEEIVYSYSDTGMTAKMTCSNGDNYEVEYRLFRSAAYTEFVNEFNVIGS